MQFVWQQATKEPNDTGKEQIGFCGKDIGSFTVLNFQRVDRAFHSGSAVVDMRELIGSTGDAGIKAQILSA